MNKILIVEDDKELIAVYAQILTDNGFTVMQAKTALEAKDKLREAIPDLILLDVMLPGGMNGFDLLEELKRDPKFSSIPVIMLTNLDSEEKTAREIGVKDYIIKANTSIDDLVAKVKEYLSS